jgi:hypothetical protein
MLYSAIRCKKVQCFFGKWLKDPQSAGERFALKERLFFEYLLKEWSIMQQIPPLSSSEM